MARMTITYELDDADLAKLGHAVNRLGDAALHNLPMLMSLAQMTTMPGKKAPCGCHEAKPPTPDVETKSTAYPAGESSPFPRPTGPGDVK